MIKNKEQRVGVFFDIQNLYHSAKNLYQARVNYQELLKKAVAGRKLIRAIAYVVKSEGAEEISFFEALEKIGIELRIKELQIYPDGTKKADWDVGLAVDAIRLAPTLDALIIATGDGDFLPLVEYLKGIGKIVEIIAFAETASSRLKEAADDFFDIGIAPEKFLIGIPRRYRRVKIRIKRI